MEKSNHKYDFSVRWEPFLLRPNMPKEGMEKAPVTSGNSRVGARLKEAGTEVGIDFTGKCDIYPNTLQAHALLEYVKSCQPAKQNDVAEALFQAYFTDGLAPNEPTLLGVAEKHGLNKEEVSSIINDESRIQQAAQAAQNWSLKGVSGVPHFFMNGQTTFSGAQDPDSFVRVFDIIAEKFPNKEPEEGSGIS